MKIAALPENEAERLAALRETGLLDTPPEARYDDLARLAAFICGTPIALVSLVDANRQWFKARVGLAATETPRNQAFCSHAILESSIYEVEDALADDWFVDNPLVALPPNIRFYAGTPLVTRAGAALGTLCVIDREPRKLGPEQRAALEALGRQVVAQIELGTNAARLAAEVKARTAAEEQARQQTLELQQSAALHQAILEATDFSIMSTDGFGIVRSANAACERLLGYAASELLGKPMPMHLYDEGELAARAAELSRELRRPVKAGREVLVARPLLGLAETRTWNYTRKDGSKFPGELTVTAMKTPGGKLIGFLGIGKDVSELQAIDRMKSEFVSTVSHELRTPLTSIRGSLRILEAQIKGPLTEGALKLVRIASTNSERLIRLINDILDIEKIEAGKLELKVKVLDAAVLAEKALDGIRGMADQAGVHLAGQVPIGLQLSGDEDRLIQVFTNLLSNAVKYSARGDTVLLGCAAREGGDKLRFSVTDKGPGIPAAEQKKLYGKFQQLDSSDTRKRGGTGLGLAISKAITEQHGGTVGVWSQLGRGSTFWVDLPAEKRAESSSPLPPNRLAEVAGRGPVLLVEDNADVAQVVTMLLRADGLQVSRAGSIEEAKRSMERERPSLVLLDLGLPDGDGLLLLEWARARPETREVPVIVLSGRAPDQGVLGMPLLVDWLQKPFDAAALASSLRRALRQGGNVKALVIEDDESARQVLVEQLQLLQIQALVAVDGREALRLANSERPELIILDIGLPLIDGFGVVEILRQGLHRNTPLIVYSGRDLSAEERKALSLGITRHVTKATGTEEEFLTCVRQMLGHLRVTPGAPANEPAPAAPEKAAG